MTQKVDRDSVSIQANGDITINDKTVGVDTGYITITTDQPYYVFKPPKNTCKVDISFCTYYCQKTPNWFHRFMTNLLLGWKWEILKN